MWLERACLFRTVSMLLRIIHWHHTVHAVLMFCNYFTLKKATVETVDSVFCSSVVLNPEVVSPHKGLRDESKGSRDAYQGRKQEKRCFSVLAFFPQYSSFTLALSLNASNTYLEKKQACCNAKAGKNKIGNRNTTTEILLTFATICIKEQHQLLLP